VNEGIPARAAAQAILSEVLRRKLPFDLTLHHLDGLSPRDAGFARTIAAETLRRLGQIEAIARQFVPAANRDWENRFPGLFTFKNGMMATGPGASVVARATRAARHRAASRAHCSPTST